MSTQVDWLLFEQTLYTVREFSYDDQQTYVVPVGLAAKPAQQFMSDLTHEYTSKGMLLRLIPILLVHDHLSPRVFVYGTSPEESSLPVFSWQRFEAQNVLFREKLSEIVKYKGSGYQGDYYVTFDAKPKQGSSTPDLKPAIGEFLGNYWAPEFQPKQNYLPYIPAHITRPKERVMMYQVVLPPECEVFVPKGMRGFFLSFQQCLSHSSSLLNALPHILARFTFKFSVCKRHQNLDEILRSRGPNAGQIWSSAGPKLEGPSSLESCQTEEDRSEEASGVSSFAGQIPQP